MPQGISAVRLTNGLLHTRHVSADNFGHHRAILQEYKRYVDGGRGFSFTLFAETCRV